MEKQFKLHCFECDTTMNEIYNGPENIPEDKKCKNCSTQLHKDFNSVLEKSYKEKYEEGEVDFFTLLHKYQLKTKAIENLSKETSALREALIEAVRNEGQLFGTNSQKITSGNQEIILQQRKNVNPLKGAVNFLKQQGHEDCLKTDIKVDRNQLWKKFENGLIDSELFQNFFEVSYTDTFSIKKLK